MNNTYLLDTTVIIELFNQNPQILQRLSQAQNVAISVVVLGELYFGAFNSPVKRQESLQQVIDYANANTILMCDSSTAEIYGRIRKQQSNAGKMIPANDLWIAATAIQHNLMVATLDQHFTQVTGLGVELWQLPPLNTP